MSHKILSDARLFLFLLLIDRDITTRARLKRCPYCGGILDVADFPRKPRGHLGEVPDGFDVRFSLCCRNDGCRRRFTPASVRFAGRRVYLGIVTIIVGAMEQGVTDFRKKELRAKLGIDYATIRSWERFWRDLFPATDAGQKLRAWFPDGILPEKLVSATWRKLSRFVGTAMDLAVAVGQLLVRVLIGDFDLDEKIIKTLSVLAYTQRTPADR